MQYEDRSASGFSRRKAQKAVASFYTPANPPVSVDASVLTALRQGRQTIVRTPITTVCGAAEPIPRDDPGCCSACIPCDAVDAIPIFIPWPLEDIEYAESILSEELGTPITLTPPEGSIDTFLLLATPACDGATYSATLELDGNTISTETDILGVGAAPESNIPYIFTVIWIMEPLVGEVDPILYATSTNACSSVTQPAVISGEPGRTTVPPLFASLRSKTSAKWSDLFHRQTNHT
jgi:hypothetical protein